MNEVQTHNVKSVRVQTPFGDWRAEIGLTPNIGYRGVGTKPLDAPDPDTALCGALVSINLSQNYIWHGDKKFHVSGMAHITRVDDNGKPDWRGEQHQIRLDVENISPRPSHSRVEALKGFIEKRLLEPGVVALTENGPALAAGADKMMKQFIRYLERSERDHLEGLEKVRVSLAAYRALQERMAFNDEIAPTPPVP